MLRLNKAQILAIFLCCLLPQSFVYPISNPKVSLKLQDATLQIALELLAEQTAIDFVYEHKLPENIRITCDYENTPLLHVLTEILQKKPITFKAAGKNKIMLVWRDIKIEKITLSGRLFDKEDGMPIANANVFLANTTMGSATNDSGRFVIPNVPLGTFDLVASRLGYEVLIQKLYVNGANEELTLQLAPKPFQAPEIEVSATELKAWKKKFAKFRELLLSTTQNAAECKILNPYILEFIEKKNRVLKVAAQEPLIIENRALGYKLYYVLESFTASPSLITIRAYSRFEKLSPKTPKEKQRWKQNRLKAYRGSLRHFLACLSRNSRLMSVTNDELMIDNDYVAQEGFRVFFVDDPVRQRGKMPLYDPKSLLRPTESRDKRILAFPNYLLIHYKKEKIDKNYLDFSASSGFPNKQVSFMSLTVDSLVIDTFGNVYDNNGLRIDRSGIKTSGYWSWERIADRLPGDYAPPSPETDIHATRPKQRAN